MLKVNHVLLTHELKNVGSGVEYQGSGIAQSLERFAQDRKEGKEKKLTYPANNLNL